MNNTKTMITTQAELRKAFWQGCTHLRSHYKQDKRQNDYSATIRSEWVEFVDCMQRTGSISEALANRATL
jgi:hypothetical protein